MRVITGTARGRKLRSPDGYDVRPTTEITKEALFSILQFELEGARVLDLFAGSGQLGIEALSRGAGFCTFVDSARASQDLVRQNLTSTGLGANARVMPMDYLAFLQSTRETFDIALLDPPDSGTVLFEGQGHDRSGAAAPGGEDVRIRRDRL